MYSLLPGMYVKDVFHDIPIHTLECRFHLIGTARIGNPPIDLHEVIKWDRALIGIALILERLVIPGIMGRPHRDCSVIPGLFLLQCPPLRQQVM